MALRLQGLLIAVTIITCWVSSIGYLLATNITKFPVWLLPVVMLWQMFLYTGLFITAHDAMHGAVLPQNPRVNTFVGRLSVLLYGLFSYKKLLQNHWLHHHYPASDRDPDFHDGTHANLIAWYTYFMRRYWGWRQLIGFTIVYQVATLVLHVSPVNLFLFWVIPSILSSIQLFYFGTFLTHSEPKTGYTNSHRAQTNALPVFWSFITCYHFGYHEEHHECPHVPWWQLPSVHKQQLQAPISFNALRGEEVV